MAVRPQMRGRVFFEIIWPMVFFLLFVSYIAFVINLGAPPLVSSASGLLLLVEHTTVLVLSRAMIYRTLNGCANSRVKERFYCFFLIGFIISLFVLHFVWTPSLNPNLEDWGYDPQRYYYYATEILRGTGTVYLLNYQGVLYFYVGCLYLFGIDPLVPLYINVLLSLYATLLIARVVSKKETITKYAWLLLIPEILRFNYEPSREILCMSGATIFLMKYIEFKQRYSVIDIILLALSFLLVAVIRLPMALPLVLGIIVYSFFFSKKQKNKVTQFFVIAFAGVLLFYAMNISSKLGSDFSGETLTESVTSGLSGNTERRADDEGSRMVTLLLPHNAFEYIVFGVIRSFAYIVPPPLILTDFTNQFSLSKEAIYPNLTVLAMFWFLPFMWRGFRRFNYLPSHIQLIAIVLVIYFLMIGISLPNLIHQRYRLVYDLFYFAFAFYCWINRGLYKRNTKVKQGV